MRMFRFAIIVIALVARTAFAADIPIGDAEQLGVRYFIPCYPSGDGSSCTPAGDSAPGPTSKVEVRGTNDGSTLRTLLTDSGGRLYVNINGTPAVTVSSGSLSCTQGTSPWVNNLSQLNGTTIATNSGTKDGGTARVILATDQPALTTPMPVAISATGASVFPELDASKTLVPVFTTVNDATETSAFTTGCSGACRRVVVCNLSTTATGCIKLSSGWATGYPLYPRGASGSPSCVAFYNVSYIAGGTNEAGLCTGAAVPFAIYPEDD